MRKFFIWLPGFYFAGAIFVAMPALAVTPANEKVTPPPKEFWDYMEEYGDDKGEVLDPLDYDQILNLKESDEPGALDKPKAKNAEMKTEQKSSARASSVAMKGDAQ